MIVSCDIGNFAAKRGAYVLKEHRKLTILGYRIGPAVINTDKMQILCSRGRSNRFGVQRTNLPLGLPK